MAWKTLRTITSVRNIQKMSKGPFRNVGLGQDERLEDNQYLTYFKKPHE